MVPAARPVGAEAVAARADDVLVLPLRATEDGIGIYSKSSVTFSEATSGGRHGSSLFASA